MTTFIYGPDKLDNANGWSGGNFYIQDSPNGGVCLSVQEAGYQGYAYKNIALVPNTTIELDFYINSWGDSLCDVWFLCDTNGIGNMLRIDARGGNYCGWATTNDFTSFNNINSYGFTTSADAWHHLKLVLDDKTATAYIDNVNIGGSAYTFSNHGGFISFNADGGSYHMVWFKNLSVAENIVNTITTGYSQTIGLNDRVLVLPICNEQSIAKKLNPISVGSKTAVIDVLTVVGTDTSVLSMDGYSYVKEHSISGSVDGDLSNYQIHFTIESGQGTDNGETIYTNSHCKAWPYDIVFTDSNGNTLSHYIESSNSSSTSVWVKMNIPSNGCNIYIFYGNPDAINCSTLATFDYYIKFAGSSLDSNWTINNTYNGGSVTINDNGVNLTAPYAAEASIIYNQSISTGIVIETKIYFPNVGNTTDNGARMRISGSNNMQSAASFDLGFFKVDPYGGYAAEVYWNGQATNIAFVNDTADGVLISEERFIPNSLYGWTVKDSSNNILTSYSTNTSLSAISPEYGCGDPNGMDGSFGQMTIQSVRLRKTTLNEPQHSTTDIEANVSNIINAAETSWAYCKTHTIRGSTDGALINYPMRFIVYAGYGVDYDNVFYLNNAAFTFPYDIMFTDTTGMVISHWIEKVEEGVAYLWVALTLPASPGNTTINIYYGGQTLDYGLGNMVFPYFDNFKYTNSMTGAVIAGTADGHMLNGLSYGQEWTDLGQQRGETNIWSLLYIGNGMYLAGTGQNAHILRSVDYGQTWEDLGQKYMEREIESFTITHVGNGIILAGTGTTGHILRSKDFGMRWTDLGQQFGETDITSLAHAENGITIAGCGSGYIIRSIDLGLTWSQVTQGNDWIDCLKYLENGIFLAGTDSGQVLRSDDYGATWTAQSGQYGYVTAMMYMGNGLVVAAIYNNLIYSSDYGLTWNNIFINLTPITDITAMQNVGGFGVIGTSNGHIYFSTQVMDENSWYDKGVQTSGCAVLCIEFAPQIWHKWFDNTASYNLTSGTPNGILTINDNSDDAGFMTPIGKFPSNYAFGTVTQCYGMAELVLDTDNQDFNMASDMDSTSTSLIAKLSDHIELDECTVTGTVNTDYINNEISFSTWHNVELGLHNQNMYLSVDGMKLYENQSIFSDNVYFNLVTRNALSWAKFSSVYIRPLANNEPIHELWAQTTLNIIKPLVGVLGYEYYKIHTMNGSTDGNLSNYQIKLIINSGNGTDGGNTVYLNNHALDFPNDLMFTDSTGHTLAYWIDPYQLSSTQVVVWIKIPSINISPQITQIYVYYGKKNDINRSDGNKTFLFFDDFKYFDNTKWDLQINDGTVTWTNDGVEISKNHDNGGTSEILFSTINTYSGHVAIGHRYRGYFNWNGSMYCGVTDANNPMVWLTGFWGSDTSYITSNIAQLMVNYGWNGSNPTPEISNNYSDFIETETVITDKVRLFYANGTVINDSTNFAESLPSTTRYGLIALVDDNKSTTAPVTTNMNSDLFYIRNATQNSPTHSSWSAEVTQSSQTQQSLKSLSKLYNTVPALVDSLPVMIGSKVYVFSDKKVGNRAIGLSLPFNGYGYGYLKYAAVVGSEDGDLFDYQICVTVMAGIGVDGNNILYLNNNSINFPNDITFIDIITGKILSYWVQSYDSTQATIWIKLNIPADGTNIGVLYGREAPLSNSDGKETFIMFDDFKGAYLSSNWIGNQSSPQMGGSVIITNPTYLTSTSIFDEGTAVMIRVKMDESNAGGIYGFYNNANQYTCINFRNDGMVDGYIINQNTTNTNTQNIDQTVYHNFEIQRNTDGTVVFVIDGVASTPINNAYAGYMSIVLMPYMNIIHSGGGNETSENLKDNTTTILGVATVDMVIVRKITLNEPVINGASVEYQIR